MKGEPIISARERGLSETPPLRINSPPGGNERQGGIPLTGKPLVNGEEKPTLAEALNQFLDALTDFKKPGTTAPTSLLATTSQGTFIVFVTHATTAGTPRTIEIMTGQVRELKRMLHAIKPSKSKRTH